MHGLHMWPVISSEDVSPFHTHPGNVLLWYLQHTNQRQRVFRTAAVAADVDREKDNAPYCIRGDDRLVENRACNQAGYARHLKRRLRKRADSVVVLGLILLTRCRNSIASNLDTQFS